VLGITVPAVPGRGPRRWPAPPRRGVGTRPRPDQAVVTADVRAADRTPTLHRRRRPRGPGNAARPAAGLTCRRSAPCLAPAWSRRGGPDERRAPSGQRGEHPPRPRHHRLTDRIGPCRTSGSRVLSDRQLRGQGTGCSPRTSAAASGADLSLTCGNRACQSFAAVPLCVQRFRHHRARHPPPPPRRWTGPNRFGQAERAADRDGARDPVRGHRHRGGPARPGVRPPAMDFHGARYASGCRWLGQFPAVRSYRGWPGERPVPCSRPRQWATSSPSAARPITDYQTGHRPHPGGRRPASPVRPHPGDPGGQ
jgi:hypothetical protein